MKILTKFDIPISVLRDMIGYDPETGVFTWRERHISTFTATDKKSAALICRSWNKRNAGKRAGSLNNKGYEIIVLFNKNLKAHHIAWAIFYGEWPKNQIDHENGVRCKNNIGNLREATESQNSQNICLYKNNTSGYVGVSWHKRLGRWQARIGTEGRILHLGYYEDPKDASGAYTAGKMKYHKFQPVLRPTI